jgi:hypothetical protein
MLFAGLFRAVSVHLAGIGGGAWRQAVAQLPTEDVICRTAGMRPWVG